MTGGSDLFWALAMFVSVTLITPGPNNIMLMTSGLNYGFRRSLPHLAGVAIGFAFMVLLVGLGLGVVFEAWPVLYTGLKWAGAAYLLYLAWGIARSGPIDTDTASEGKPMTFLQAAAFQWVNPKAWVMAFGAISTYAGVAVFPVNILIVVALFGVLGLGSSGAWVVFGHSLRRLLTNPRAVRWFNWAMALALMISLYPVIGDNLR